MKVTKRLVAWILTNSYGRHNTKDYAREVHMLCDYVTMLLNEPISNLGLVQMAIEGHSDEDVRKRTLDNVVQCIKDSLDEESEMYEWKFDYSDEFNQMFERKEFTKRPLFFAENIDTNELVAYGI